MNNNYDPAAVTILEWEQMMLAKQIEIINGTTGLSEPQRMQLVAKAEMIMNTKRCDSCMLKAHITSYCPWNSMMYHELRGDELYDAWLLVRAHIRADKKKARLRKRHNVEANIIEQ